MVDHFDSLSFKCLDVEAITTSYISIYLHIFPVLKSAEWGGHCIGASTAPNFYYTFWVVGVGDKFTRNVWIKIGWKVRLVLLQLKALLYWSPYSQSKIHFRSSGFWNQRHFVWFEENYAIPASTTNEECYRYLCPHWVVATGEPNPCQRCVPMLRFPSYGTPRQGENWFLTASKNWEKLMNRNWRFFNWFTRMKCKALRTLNMLRSLRSLIYYWSSAVQDQLLYSGYNTIPKILEFHSFQNLILFISVFLYFF